MIPRIMYSAMADMTRHCFSVLSQIAFLFSGNSSNVIHTVYGSSSVNATEKGLIYGSEL